MANPQAENGHTKIANEIMDALCRTRIPGEERQVLDCIFRKTYGWNKTEDAISLSQFIEMTGLKKPNIIRAIKGLLSKKIIGVIKKDNETAHVYKINKDYDQWQPLSKKITLSKKIIGVIKKDNLALSKTIPTKDTITKDTITKDRGPRTLREPQQSDEEWLEGLKKSPAYTGIDVNQSYNKMLVWCETNGKKPTRRRFVNWLNREERPLQKQTNAIGDQHGKTTRFNPYQRNYRTGCNALDPKTEAEADRIAAEYYARKAAAGNSEAAP